VFASPARAGTTAGHNFYCQTPQARGYSSFLGYFSPANGYWTHEEEGGTLRDLWRSGPLAGDEGPAVELLNDPHCTADTQVAASAGGRCQYLDELLEAQAHQLLLAHDYSNASSAPLFLFWSPHATHSPVEPPVCRGTRLLNLRTRRVAQPGLPHTHALASPRPVQAAWAAELESWPDEQTCSAKGSYQRRRQALIADLDARVGRVVATLQDRGAPVWERTLLIFASDNGGDFHANNWPLKGGKRTNWEGGVRVAAFVAGGFLPASQRATTNHGLSAGWDWYATLAGLAGVDTHDAKAAAQGLPPVSSHDLWPMLSGRSRGSPRSELLVGANEEWTTDKIDQAPHKDTRGAALVSGVIVPPYKLLLGEARHAFRMTHGETVWGQPATCPVDHTWPMNNSKRFGRPMPPLVCGVTAETGCLFDIWQAPTETKNLAASKPALFYRMLARVREAQQSVYSPKRSGADAPPLAVTLPDGRPVTFLGPSIHLSQLVADRRRAD